MAQKYEDWSGHTVAQGVPTGYSLPLTTNAGDYFIEDNLAAPGDKHLRITNVGGGQVYFAPDDIASAAQQQVFTMLTRSATPDNSTSGGPGLRIVNGSSRTRYSVISWTPTIDNQDFRITRFEDGVSSVAVVTAAFTFSANTVYCMLAEAVDTNLRAKIWQPADVNDPRADEPATWTIEGTNADITSGLVGFGIYSQASGNVDFYSVGFGTGGDPAPMTAGEAGGLDVPGNFTFAKVLDTRQIDAAADTVTDANSYELEWEEWDGSVWQPQGIESNATPAFTLTDVDGVDWGTLYRGRMRAMP